LRVFFAILSKMAARLEAGAKHGRQGNMMKWKEQLNADCPKRDGRLNASAGDARFPERFRSYVH
jgi:hypothetical protein